jgi:phosphoribosyl 1,2-cyclic phosphodiesterase
LALMPVFFTSLNSGSNGNCYYVGNSSEAVLVDAGISCRETEKRMQALGLDMRSVKAIFISHEHSDHITGLSILSKKYQLPVYITDHTLQESHVHIDPHLVRSVSADLQLHIGRLSVTPFKKSHDACDPHSFVVSDGVVNIGVFTDIGVACPQVIRYFRKCHAVFLESNYCPDMLSKGSYPVYLKRRISSDTGHLSNMQALDLFSKFKTRRLTHLVLSHLSENNNNPQLVNDLFSNQAGSVKIVVASRYEATPVYHIDAANAVTEEVPEISIALHKPLQLSLF